MRMRVQVKQSFTILSTWQDTWVQKEAGRGTLQDQSWQHQTDFTPTHRHPDYSERLCKPPAPSSSLLTTSSPMQASPPQALIQSLAQTRASQGQSCPCTSPTTITSPSQLLHPNASKHTLPRKPQHLPGRRAGALSRLARHLGGCRHFPGAPQTDTERGWSDAPR